MKFSKFIIESSKLKEIHFFYPKQPNGYSGFIIIVENKDANEISREIAEEVYKLIKKQSGKTQQEIQKELEKELKNDMYFKNSNQMVALVNNLMPRGVEKFLKVKFKI